MMEQMRQDGRLKPNCFVSLERLEASQAEHLLRIEDHGDAEMYLSSTQMRKAANSLIQRGVIGTNAEYGGWLPLVDAFRTFCLCPGLVKRLLFSKLQYQANS